MIRKQSTFVPPRVRDDMSLINMHKMAHAYPMEPYLGKTIFIPSVNF